MRGSLETADRSLRFADFVTRRALAWRMSYSEPSPEQEVVGGGAQSVPKPVDPKTEKPEEVEK